MIKTSAFRFINPSQGALIQEGIDVIAILWALTALNTNVVRRDGLEPPTR